MLDVWFWAMFESPIWPDFTFGKLFIWIWANNDQLWLPRGQMSDLEQCLNWLFFVARKSILNTELSGRQASCVNFMFSLPLKIPWTFFSIMISLCFGTHGMFLQNNNRGLTVLIVRVSGQHNFGTRVRYWGILMAKWNASQDIKRGGGPIFMNY